LKLPFTKLWLVSESPLALRRPFPIWLRYSSLFTLVAAVGFLVLSLAFYRRNAGPAESLVPSLLVALLFALFLNIYSFWRLRKEHGEVDRAFLNTDCEFSSIFQNVLDGILIVNNEGDCLDANPAAAGILRTSTHELIGSNIDRFLVDCDKSTNRWSSFLPSQKRRGRIELIAGDGTKLFVDFTAATNYLPGRHVLVVCDVTERTQAELFLRESKERFQEMADNIEEIFWRMDACTQEIAYVNRAYTTITGQDTEALRTGPSAYQELIHPEDRIRILGRLRDLATSGTLDEEFRFIRSDGEVRWIWAKGFPVPADGEIRWLVGTAQDVTSRKKAELKIVEQLDAVEAARAEAEALRKSTLALSQNLAMDSVLDTLLGCIQELVPFDKAAVLFVEDGAELLVAREAPRGALPGTGKIFPASYCSRLQEILYGRKSLLVPDLSGETDCKKLRSLWQVRSWIGVPLVAAGQVLGILSLGKNFPNTYTPEHLRLAKSLAIPAAVAIHNARIHERAEIYAAELEARLKELNETQKALEHLGGRILRSGAS
jgi:PAS domain S-box-containing protein